MRKRLEAVLRELGQDAPEAIDLTNPDHGRWATEAAEQILTVVGEPEDLERLESDLAERGAPVGLGLAGKLARSRRAVRDLHDPVHTSVVVALYSEHLRMLPASDHPGGEDFLRRKLSQLRWLFQDTPHTWDLVLVDDGCPNGSGALAQEIIDAEGAGGEARVLFLQDAIERGLPPARDLESPADSRKGGSIRYGLWDAERRLPGDGVLLFTDADLSTHLGQTGLLVEPIVAGGAAAAIGSRREPTSVVVKRGARNTRGKLFIYLWKRLIPQLRGIVDTQCGFKAFRPGVLEQWYDTSLESGFAFDIEMLLHVRVREQDSVTKVPVAWIDSDALSTTTGLEPYADMLRKAAEFYRAYLPTDPVSELFSQLIDGLDKEAFQRLLDDVPPAIAGADPASFDEFEGVGPVELARRAGISG